MSELENRIKLIEANSGITFPHSYVDYRKEHENIAEFDKLYLKGKFLDDYMEIKRVVEFNHIPENLFSFFVDKDAGMSGGIFWDDIYCFNLEKNSPDYVVEVFSIHTTVAEWKNFSAWIEWSRSKQNK